MSCAEYTCRGGIDCCQVANGVQFCLTESQCINDPIWQMVVVWGFITLVAICIALIIFCKLRNKQKKKLSIQNFANEQVRMEPKASSHQRLKTLTTLY